MLWTENPKKMAEQIRSGTLKRIDIVAVLDEPTTSDGLPVLWVTNQAGEKQFALTQSHADTNRGVAKAGETWRLWINRFGEIFLTEKVLPTVLQELEATPQGYECAGVSFQDGKYRLHWVPTKSIVLKDFG